MIPWRDLKIAGRHAIADQRQRMTFEQQVDIADYAWKKQFQRIWHIQLLKDQNEQIEVDRQRSIPEEDGPSLREIIVTRCRLALGSVDAIIHSLRDTLLTACDAELLGMFRLGQHVDRLVHPVPAFAELLTSDSDALPQQQRVPHPINPPHGESSYSQLMNPSCRARVTTREQGGRFGTLPIDRLPGDCRAIRGPVAHRMLGGRNLRLLVASGLESSVLQQLQCVSDVDVNGSHSSSQRIVDRIEAVVTQSPTDATGSEDKSRGSNPTAQSKKLTDGVDQILKDLVSEDPEERLEWTRFKSVGIEIQRESQRVRRIGSDQVIGIRSLLKLQGAGLHRPKRGLGLRSREELSSEWETLGGKSDGEKLNQQQWPSAIRRALKTIGLKLDISNGVGWRIVEDSDSEV